MKQKALFMIFAFLAFGKELEIMKFVTLRGLFLFKEKVHEINFGSCRSLGRPTFCSKKCSRNIFYFKHVVEPNSSAYVHPPFSKISAFYL